MNLLAWYRHISTNAMRSLVSALMVLAVVLGPYSFAGHGHAEEHQSHSSSDHHHGPDTGHHGEPDQMDHKGVGHALTHCGSAFCAPSYVATSAYVPTHTIISHRVHLSFGNETTLKSLYLDADPPVPRRNFSKA